MKLFVFLGLVILLTLSDAGMVSAKMYWDGTGDTDTTITDKDFLAKPPNRQVTTTSLPKMYDDYKVLDIDSEGIRQDVPQAVAPIRRRSGTTSVQPSRKKRTASPPAVGPRRPQTTPAEPSMAITDKPQPVAGTPGKGPVSKKASTREVTQVSGQTEKSSEVPVTKKLPWGQMDVKSAEPGVKKFDWGEK